MNEIAKVLTDGPKSWPTTQAAEGVPRLRWTMADFDRLTELGVFGEKDRIELIGGELVPMAAKGDHHEIMKDELHNWLIRRLPPTAREGIEMGWRPEPDTYMEPDIMIYSSAARAPYIAGDQVLLMIEVSHSSLWIDLGLRAKTMASLGVREYWVVNAIKHEVTVHRDPTADGFKTKVVEPPASRITPLYVPELALRIADLQLGD